MSVLVGKDGRPILQAKAQDSSPRHASAGRRHERLRTASLAWPSSLWQNRVSAISSSWWQESWSPWQTTKSLTQRSRLRWKIRLCPMHMWPSCAALRFSMQLEKITWIVSNNALADTCAVEQAKFLRQSMFTACRIELLRYICLHDSVMWNVSTCWSTQGLMSTGRNNNIRGDRRPCTTLPAERPRTRQRPAARVPS